jgi:hypothetical protein
LLPDYYELFGVNSKAPSDEVRTAYKRLLRQTHPDTGGTSGLFILIEQAWAVLSDPAKRAAYDKERSGGLSPESGEPETETSSGGDDDFRRGYADEAGRASFREDRAAQERRRQQEREEARVQAEVAAQRRARREAERLLPYTSAVAQLTAKEREVHYKYNVRLDYLMKLPQLRRWRVPFVLAASAALSVVAALITSPSVGLEPAFFWGMFLTNVATFFVATAILLFIATVAAFRALRVGAPRRVNVPSALLQEEFISAMKAKA